MRVRLRQWRERRLLTQRELAARVGMSPGQINRIERGLARPRLRTIRRLAEVLDVSPDELVEWEERDPPQNDADGPAARAESPSAADDLPH